LDPDNQTRWSLPWTAGIEPELGQGMARLSDYPGYPCYQKNSEYSDQDGPADQTKTTRGVLIPRLTFYVVQGHILLDVTVSLHKYEHQETPSKPGLEDTLQQALSNSAVSRSPDSES